MTDGRRDQLVEATRQCYDHAAISERELLRFKILHHLRRGNRKYAAQLAIMEREGNGQDKS